MDRYPAAAESCPRPGPAAIAPRATDASFDRMRASDSNVTPPTNVADSAATAWAGLARVAGASVGDSASGTGVALGRERGRAAGAAAVGVAAVVSTMAAGAAALDAALAALPRPLAVFLRRGDTLALDAEVELGTALDTSGQPARACAAARPSAVRASDGGLGSDRVFEVGWGDREGVNREGG
eukprot:scaffold14885_cov65-Phaeocystis_antarctica.AAC.17